MATPLNPRNAVKSKLMAGTGGGPTITRQSEFRAEFESAMKALKSKHGCGVCSWAEGVTRHAMRRVAIKQARQRVKVNRVARRLNG